VMENRCLGKLKRRREIFGEPSRAGEDGFDFVLQLRRVTAAQDVLRNKICRPPRGFAERDAQSQKILGDHASNKLKLHRSER
jgi:hypothetical protein